MTPNNAKCERCGHNHVPVDQSPVPPCFAEGCACGLPVTSKCERCGHIVAQHWQTFTNVQGCAEADCDCTAFLKAPQEPIAPQVGNLFVIWVDDASEFTNDLVDKEANVFSTLSAANGAAIALAAEHGCEVFVATIRPERIARVTLTDVGAQ